MVTIKMVAMDAKVSTATVSRVINEHPSCTKETILKVKNSINKLGYRPNSIAQSLRSQKSGSFITIINDIQNPVVAGIIRGIEDIAYKNNYSMIVGNTGNSFARESDYLNVFLSGKVDGMILITPHERIEKIIELSKKMPIVLINDYRSQVTIPVVRVDDYQAVRELSNYVVSKGHRRIAYILGDSKESVALMRRRGFTDSMEANKVKDYIFVRGGVTVQSGMEAMRMLLSAKKIPTCVIGYNDEIAIGAMKYAHSVGIKIGEEISFCGFNNIPASQLIIPTLTTIEQPTYEMGVKASEILVRKINGESIPYKTYYLKHKILEGDSVFQF